MNRYLFLLAWVEGSDSASGEETKVHSQDDLYPQLMAGNEHIFAVEVRCSREDIAAAYGYREAFFDNYTAHDSVSEVQELEDNWVSPETLKCIVQADA